MYNLHNARHKITLNELTYHLNQSIKLKSYLPFATVKISLRKYPAKNTIYIRINKNCL